MTNYEKWRSYTDGLTSPNSFIDWGWYYLISASLQRRIWTGPSHVKLYPNVYVILVGEPAVGKGLVTRQLTRILRHHKLNPHVFKKTDANQLNDEEKKKFEEASKTEFEDASKREEAKHKQRISEKPLLIPVGAHATTYEALVNSLASSLRRINYPEFDPTTQKNVLRTYSHSSLCFCLEEISSMFRKRTEDVARFLLETYDCQDYEYDTKTPGLKDYVKKCCLNLIGGTTPGFMQELFSDQLLTEGFASRCFFIFAHRNRKTSMFIPDLTPEQVTYYDDILSHVKKLTELYGRVTYSDESRDFLEERWKKIQTERPNTSYRLNHYYGRWNLHVMKMAMAVHFSESTEMHIHQSTFEKTIEVLAREEKKMHFALGIDNTNPLAAPANKIYKYLQHSSRKLFKELIAEFWGILPGRPSPSENLEMILEHLVLTGKVLKTQDVHPITQQQVYFYTTLKEEQSNKMPGEL